MSHDCRGDLDPQTMVSCKLYGRRRLRREVLGSAEKTLGELFEGSSTSADIQLYNGTSEIAVLKDIWLKQPQGTHRRTRTEH
ncbi:hypothetical protein EDD85DRAFT_955219 [Armillaria nabsnona]|nr:hypothetical protein EDD85DRAFT_955219 [Armillaria nabsnona]